MDVPPHAVLLISTFGDDGRGGLFVFDGESVDAIDDLPTTGISYHEGHLARALRSSGDHDTVGELLVYDEVGVREYRRLDDAEDLHDVVHDGLGWLLVSTSRNALLRFDGRSVETIWQPSVARDSWHINCLAVVDGQPWITGFGCFDVERGWTADAARGTGFLRNLRTDVELVGLTHPHSPRFVDGRFYVCESLDRRVVRVDVCTGEREVLAHLGGYTRGVAIHGDVMFVGESANRSQPDLADAAVAIVSAVDGTVRGRLSLPASEVYDVALVPATVVDGLRRGFDTNAQRIALQGARRPWRPLETDRDDLLATGQPLAGRGCRVAVSVQGEPPTSVASDATLRVDVVNLASIALSSIEPHPVLISYRWRSDDGQIDGPRTAVSGVLRADDARSVEVCVTAPDVPGRYRLHVSLVQEGVFWFDDEDPRNGVVFDVDVERSAEVARQA